MKIVNRTVDKYNSHTFFANILPGFNRGDRLDIAEYLVTGIADQFREFTSYGINNKPILAYHSITFEDERVDI